MDTVSPKGSDTIVSMIDGTAGPVVKADAKRTVMSAFVAGPPLRASRPSARGGQKETQLSRDKQIT